MFAIEMLRCFTANIYLLHGNKLHLLTCLKLRETMHTSTFSDSTRNVSTNYNRSACMKYSTLFNQQSLLTYHRMSN